MIKITLIALAATGVIGTGAVQADLAPQSAEMTAGFVKVEFGGPDGFNTRFTKTMEFNIKFKSEDGNSVTIRL
jgi:hypothetical protein